MRKPLTHFKKCSFNSSYEVVVNHHCDYCWWLERRETVPSLISNSVSYDGDWYTVCYNYVAIWVSAGNAVRDANIGNMDMQKTKWQDAEGLCVNNAFPCKYGECLSPGKKMMCLRNKEMSYAKIREVWYIWRKAFLVMDKKGLGNGKCMQSKPCQQ